MGLLADGKWVDRWYDTAGNAGRFVRSSAKFRNFVTADGEPGPTGSGGFKAEAGRYHLYVSLACPWAHRTLIMRKLKRLDAIISVSTVHWLMLENGWTFEKGPGATGDALHGASFLWQVYTRADPAYSGRVTVPVLWDKKRNTIVSNESPEIIRMMNSAFDTVGADGPDLYPSDISAEIDRVNELVYRDVNNGVYRCGFATTQEAYEEAFAALFAALGWLEERLSRQRYLAGECFTEADIRLFTTLIRFDAVYVGHFKCNQRRIEDYPNLSNYLRDIFQMPGIAETVDMTHIKGHYYASHRMINPTGIVPAGPAQDFTQPHDRARFVVHQ